MDLLITGLRPPVIINLFGRFDTSVNGMPLPKMRSTKEQHLLALLALSKGKALSRRWLAETLWPYPDHADEHIGQYLRRSLMILRRALEPYSAIIESPQPDTISLNLNLVCCDLVEFDNAIVSSTNESLFHAITLYKGPLLETCDEYWITSDRIKREDAYLKACEKLAESALILGDTQACRDLVRSAELKARFSETMQSLLMQSYAADGQLNDAIQTYRKLRNRLLEDFSCEPRKDTTAKYLDLRQSAIVSVRRSHPDPPIDSQSSQRVVLPRNAVQLIGRENDLSNVLELLQLRRIVTICGPGGIGKTSLAIEAATKVAQDDKCDVYFIDLLAISDPALIATLLASTLEIPVSLESAAESIVRFIGSRDLMIIFDNCEHVLNTAQTLASQLIGSCPNIRILATSREPLRTSGESLWRLKGLSLPQILLRPENSTAVQLFNDRAMAAVQNFTVTQRTIAAVSEICIKLDGIPLAIELAAAALRAMTVNELSQRLNEYLRAVEEQDPPHNGRHGTLRAVFEWSYNLLSEYDKSTLTNLAVFKGSFSIDAARSVCQRENADSFDIAGDATLGAILRLVDKSLLIFESGADGTSRYRIVSNVRDLLAQHLIESGEVDSFNKRLMRWLICLAAEAMNGSTGSEQEAYANSLDLELENIRGVLSRAPKTYDELEDNLVLTNSLAWFWKLRGLCTNAYESIKRMIEDPQIGQSTELYADSTFTLGFLANALGQNGIAKRHFSTALTIFRNRRLPSKIASTLIAFGEAENNLGNYVDATRLFEEALELTTDKESCAVLFGHLGFAARQTGDFNAARMHLLKSIDLSTQTGNQLQRGASLGSLAYILKEQERTPAAVDAALEKLGETLKIYTSLRNLPGTAWTLASIAHIHLQRGDDSECLRLTQEALEINTHIHNISGAGWNQRIIAEILIRQSKLLEAEIILHQLITHYKSIGDEIGEAWTLFLLARVESRRNRLDEARRIYNNVGTLMKKLCVPDGIAAVQQELSALITTASSPKMPY